MPPSLNTLRVLVVEDHEFQRTMLEQALRLLGVEQIRSADNGAGAMRLLRADPAVDVIITDVVMPDVDGIELIPMLRDIAKHASLVILSSEAWTLDVGKVIAKGHGLSVLGVLPKPVRPQTLRALLETHLQRRAGAPGPA